MCLVITRNIFALGAPDVVASQTRIENCTNCEQTSMKSIEVKEI